MTDQNKKIFIGVAWPYVNGDLHPGHLAGCYIPADIFARFSRLRGNETLMVSGTDCWGTPITIEADKRGVTPNEIVDLYNPRTKSLMKKYNISFDLFTETITTNHQKVTQELFLNLLSNGFIIKKSSIQYYSELEKKFLPDRYVEGECPHCHSKDQRGDQCENCGRSLAVGELINPISKLTGSNVILKETEHYFVDLKKLEPQIKLYLEDQQKKDEWRTWVIKEALGWTNEGLEPRAITRDIDWGVKIPVDEVSKINPDLIIDGAENKRFYVWFDAVIGYYSAAIEWANDRSANTLPDNGLKNFYSGEFNVNDWQKFWFKNDDSKIELKHYYFVGKDNLFFHTIWWQAILLGQKKENIKLSDNTSVNQFLNLEGKKFSKSRGIFIDPVKLADTFSADYIRFYITTIMPENADANWKWDDFKNTINSELIGNFGNFVNRTLSFYKNKLLTSEENLGKTNDLDNNVLIETQKVFEEVSSHLEKCEFVAALNRILQYSKFGNQYFDSKKPWLTIKEEIKEAEMTIYNCLQIVFSLNMLLYPFIPESMEKLNQLYLKEDFQNKLFPKLGINKFNFDQLDINNIRLAANIDPIFKKIENEDLEAFVNN